MTEPSLSSRSADEASPLEPLAVAQARARAWDALFGGESRGGLRLGRYVLLGELGAGAMGLVYSAYDPELDRKVAIKVVRARPGDHDGKGTSRLVREARALARLSHPNVVVVHDVGVVEPEGATTGASATVFIAMEHVRGTTMRRWLADARRPWREVIEMLEQAGRGLAAAHEVGLVHRDFKPDNVMVGEDGRVRVMDFGLARALESTPSTEVDEPHGTLSADVSHTRTGVAVGTPAYMAPEQRIAEAVDARSDQFAFCVVAWEALLGRRPSPRLDADKPLAALRPSESTVPLWVLAVLRQGLASEPEARHRDMPALLTALADDPVRRRRRRLVVGGVLVVLGLGTAGVAWDRQQRERSCRAAGAAIAEVWNDEASAGIAAAIDGTALSYAADTRERVLEGLDGYAQQWTQAREASCRAYRVDGQVDAARAARTEACLDESHDALASWIELVTLASPAEVASLTEATAELPPIDSCLDEAWLARRPMPPDDADARERARERRQRLARARGLSQLGRYDEALREAEAVETEAEADGMARLQAEAGLQAARSAFGSGDPERARAGRERALASALGIGDDELAIEALVELTVSDATGGRQERAQTWLAIARALLPRAEPEPGLLTTAVLDAGGVTAFTAGDFSAAIEQHEQALALAERILPAAHPWLTRSLNNLAGPLHRQGELARVLEIQLRVVDVRTQALGPDHPQVAKALGNLGSLYGSMGRLEQAEATLERALALTEQAYGPQHERVGTVLANLGVTRSYRGRARPAAEALERAVKILERAHGPEHPELARALSMLGVTYIDLGDIERAIESLQRALTLQERLHGSEHHNVAVTLGSLGAALLAAGRLDEADAAHRRALAIRERTLPAEHVDIASSHLELARVLNDRGRFDEALVEAGRALATYEGPADDRLNAAVTHQCMGRAQLLAGRLPEALAHYERVESIAEALDRDDLRAAAWTGVAMVHEQRGRWDEALAGFERAQRFGERSSEPDDPGLADALLGLASASHALGRLQLARAHAERALALRTSSTLPAWKVAEAELVLGEILRDEPATREQARKLVQRACSVSAPAAALRLRACEPELGRKRSDVLGSRRP